MVSLEAQKTYKRNRKNITALSEIDTSKTNNVGYTVISAAIRVYGATEVTEPTYPVLYIRVLRRVERSSQPASAPLQRPVLTGTGGGAGLQFSSAIKEPRH